MKILPFARNRGTKETKPAGMAADDDTAETVVAQRPARPLVMATAQAIETFPLTADGWGALLDEAATLEADSDSKPDLALFTGFEDDDDLLPGLLENEADTETEKAALKAWLEESGATVQAARDDFVVPVSIAREIDAAIEALRRKPRSQPTAPDTYWTEETPPEKATSSDGPRQPAEAVGSTEPTGSADREDISSEVTAEAALAIAAEHTPLDELTLPPVLPEERIGVPKSAKSARGAPVRLPPATAFSEHRLIPSLFRETFGLGDTTPSDADGTDLSLGAPEQASVEMAPPDYVGSPAPKKRLIPRFRLFGRKRDKDRDETIAAGPEKKTLAPELVEANAPKTDDAETDDAETDDAETDDAERDVAEADSGVAAVADETPDDTGSQDVLSKPETSSKKRRKTGAARQQAAKTRPRPRMGEIAIAAAIAVFACTAVIGMVLTQTGPIPGAPDIGSLTSYLRELRSEAQQRVASQPASPERTNADASAPETAAVEPAPAPDMAGQPAPTVTAALEPAAPANVTAPQRIGRAAPEQRPIQRLIEPEINPAAPVETPRATDVPLPPMLAALRDAALEGNRQAQHDLGAHYSAGRLVEQDFAQAAFWFREAAIRGVPNAQYNLGVLFQRGLGLEADTGMAVQWYRRAAENGHIEAQYNLAIALVDGLGVSPDMAEALIWFEQAASAGLAQAAYSIGVLYELGAATGNPDLLNAARWYNQAAAAGDAAAAEALARLQPRGDAAPEFLAVN